MNISKKHPKIVIVGGGSGGLELATTLGNTLGKCGKASIHLVDKNMTHIWKPLYHELAAGTFNLYIDEINYLYHASKNFYFFYLGKLCKLNREKRIIYLEAVLDHQKKIIVPDNYIAYDILIIAIGSLSNDFFLPGVRDYCIFLDDQIQAKYFHRNFLNMILNINFDHDSIAKVFQIVIVGGGATGIELAAELEYALSESIFYQNKSELLKNHIEISILESGKKILSHLPDNLIKLSVTELTRRNIKIFTEHRVTRVDPNGFYTNNGKFFPAQIKLWAAGIIAPSILQNFDGLETNKFNQLIVTSTLQTTRDQQIFSFGDCSCFYQDSGQPVPPRAQAAHQQANIMAKNILRYLNNKPLKKFYYRNYGDLLTLSKNFAFGYLMGRIGNKITLTGKIARLAYWTLYKRHQIKVLGFWSTIILIITGLLNRRKKPHVKLH